MLNVLEKTLILFGTRETVSEGAFHLSEPAGFTMQFAIKGMRKLKGLHICLSFKVLQNNGYHGLVAADGMPQLIPMRWASRHLNSNAYEVPYSRTNYHKDSFSPRIISEWNSLAEDISTLPNLDTFKKH